MIKLITYLLGLLIIVFSGCGNAGDEKEKARQDSISEAAAADSMLQDALSADTASTDSLQADSLK